MMSDVLELYRKSRIFPLLFALTATKVAFVANIWDQQNASWAMNFRRNLKDEEISKWPSLLASFGRRMGLESSQRRLLHYQIYGQQSLGGSIIKLSLLIQSHLEGFLSKKKKIKFLLWELRHTCLKP